MTEEINIQSMPSYTVLNVLAAILTIGLISSISFFGSLWIFPAVMSMFVALGFAFAAYIFVPAPVAETYGGLKQQLLAFLLPSTSVLMFVALFTYRGSLFYWLAMTMAVAFTVLYKPPKMPKLDIKVGVIGAFVMFIVVILIAFLLDQFKILSFHQAIQLLQLSWSPIQLDSQGNPIQLQINAIQMFLIVALGEELWARLTMGYGATSLVGYRTAWLWSTFWFLYLHTPSRLMALLLEPWLVPVVIGILGAVLIPFFIFYRKNPNIFTGIIMHATYNTLLSGLEYGTLFLDIAVLGLLIYVTMKIAETKIEITVPKIVKEVIEK
jgi:hypothetical protein